MKKDNRNKLIEATDKLLVTRSLSYITTKDITKESGVSVGVFYNYFESKEDIFKILVSRFFEYSLEQMECLKKNITGNNIRSEIKFKEFLIGGIDKNWENQFLNSDILLLSRKDSEFKLQMYDINLKLENIIREILVLIQPNSEMNFDVEAKIVLNIIQNAYPVFSDFDSEVQKEEYIEKIVRIVYSICFSTISKE